MNDPGPRTLLENMRLTRVMFEISHHIGRKNGIRGADLAERTALAPRELRIIISHLRDEGIAVCGYPRTGYYIAATAEELEDTCAYLRARAMHTLHLIARLKRIPLPDLIGQLRIPT